MSDQFESLFPENFNPNAKEGGKKEDKKRIMSDDELAQKMTDIVMDYGPEALLNLFNPTEEQKELIPSGKEVKLHFDVNNLKYITCTNEPYEKDKGSIQFIWGIDYFGFGTTTFYYDDNGKLFCDSECMSKDLIKKLLCAFVDQAEFEDGVDAPQKRNDQNEK